VNDVTPIRNCVTRLETIKGIFVVSLFIITKRIEIMGNLLYFIAVILIIGWAIGFIGFHAGGLIHALLVIALIAIVLRVIKGK